MVAIRRAVAALVIAVLMLSTACAAPSGVPVSPPASASGPAGPTGAGSTAPRASAGGTTGSVDDRAPAGFVALSDVDATILQDIRYDTDHNFVGRPIAGYHEPLCILTRDAAEGLHRAQTAALARGYSLKVYDCYRPQQAVDDFVSWSRRPDDQRMKAEFYPQVDKTALFDDGYIGGPSAHSRGSTMDLTLVAMPAKPPAAYVAGEPAVSCFALVGQRFPDNTVDMGTGFDCFDPRAHTLDSHVTGQAMTNRLLLRQLMKDAGFTNYTNEWWHYTLGGEPYPKTYFSFPVAGDVLAHP